MYTDQPLLPTPRAYASAHVHADSLNNSRASAKKCRESSVLTIVFLLKGFTYVRLLQNIDGGNDEGIRDETYCSEIGLYALVPPIVTHAAYSRTLLQM